MCRNRQDNASLKAKGEGDAMRTEVCIIRSGKGHKCNNHLIVRRRMLWERRKRRENAGPLHADDDGLGGREGGLG